MTITAAVACMLASTSLSVLFISSLWFAVSAGAVVAVAGAGTLTRLRTVPVAACLAAGVLGLLLYLNLVFEARHSALLVIPTPDSVARLRDLVGAGLADRNRYAPPVPNVPGLLLPAVAAVGVTAVLTDLIAVRWRRAALAGLPLGVLSIVPLMISTSHDQLADGLIFCAAGAGYLAMLSADGRASMNAKALAAAAWTGLASIILALSVPLLPVQVNKLFSSDTEAGTVSQTIAQLHESRPSVVFTYTTTASPSLQQNDAQYFRQHVFDTLSDAGWQMTSYPADAMQAGAIPLPPGLTNMSAAQPVTTTVTVVRDLPGSGGAPAFLSLPYPAIRVTAPGRWLADQDLMVYSTTSSLAGLTYRAASYAVDPSPAQLAAVPPLTGVAALAPDLQLPPSYRVAALERLAQDQASGQATEYGKVDALASWLSSPPFRYSLSATSFGSADGLLSFLTTTKTGYCVQYAYAMTVLTRLLGIPARFVTGYTAGTPGAHGGYQVKTTDAHAWAEVYFPTFGWIRFEPTPAGPGGTASRPDYMTAPTANVTSALPDPAGAATTRSASLPGGSHATAHGPGLARLTGQHHPAASGHLAGAPQMGAVLAVVAAIALTLLIPAVLRVARRQWRWMRAADDDARAHAAWREFRDDLADFGLGGPPGEPPRTLAARVSATLPLPAGAAVRRLALAEEHASYAGRPSAAQDLRRDGAAARRGLAVTARRSTRWRARLFPASLLGGWNRRSFTRST